MTFVYMSLIALLYLFLPGLFTAPLPLGQKPLFSPRSSGWPRPCYVLWPFISIFDTMNIIFFGFEGAGDTRFVMFMIVGLSGGVLAFPTWLAITVLGLGVMTA